MEPSPSCRSFGRSIAIDDTNDRLHNRAATAILGTFMKLIFTKGAGKYDHMDVVRDGAPAERVDCPKQRIIPHDMVHYAVEHTLQTRGFLGRVKEGEAAVFQMQSEATSDGVERLVEVIQGDAWSGGQSSARDLVELYEVTCSARQCPTLPVGEAEVDAIRAEIARLDSAWQALPVGGRLELVL